MLISVAIPKPIRNTFTYEALPGVHINLGSRVSVPFGNQTLIGIVVKKEANNETAKQTKKKKRRSHERSTEASRNPQTIKK